MTGPSAIFNDPISNASCGTVVEHDGTRSLQFIRMLPASIEDVWSAITDHDRMGRWAFAGHLEPRVGGAVRFAAEPGDPAEGQVLTWEEPHVLEYEWGAGEDSWRVRFTLTPQDGETRLHFQHLHPDPSNPEFAAGWHWHLDRLQQYLNGSEPADVNEGRHFHDLLRDYARSPSEKI